MAKKSGSDLRDTLSSSMPILRVVHQKGPIDQSSVAGEFGITLPAAFNHFQKLKKECLVKIVSKSESGERGRPSILWDIDKKQNYTVSIALVPPFILIGASDFEGKLVFFKQSDSSNIKTQQELLHLIDQQIVGCKRRILNRKSYIRTVSIGLPGILNDQQVVQNCANMPLITGIDFNRYFLENHGLFCRTHSHYLNFYFAEMLELPEDTTISVINWELGIGHVVGRNREIFNIIPGKNFSGTGLQDIAHMRMVKNGKNCSCGKSGCLEAYTGGWAIIRQLDRNDIRSLSDLIAFAQKEDSRVLEELSASAKFLGTQMGWVVRFLGIQRIIVTGPLSQVFEKVRSDFCDGLCKGGLTREEVDSLDPRVSSDPLRKIIKGGCSIAKDFFFDPAPFTTI